MTMRSFVRAALTVAVVATGASRLAAAPPAGRLVELTGNDLMKYSVTAITAKPGELLHVKLKNAGTLPKVAMAHNFILLAKGTDASAFANAAATASATGYIPAQFKAKILASTALAGPGEVLASGTTHDLLDGSGLAFEFRGTYELKGLTGARPIFALTR